MPVIPAVIKKLRQENQEFNKNWPNCRVRLQRGEAVGGHSSVTDHLSSKPEILYSTLVRDIERSLGSS